MELQVIQSSIEREFAAFIADVEIKNRSGKFDINIVAETLFISILNALYSCNLHNANLDKKNQDGYDLIDDEAKIIVQVTATNTLEKLKSSIIKCNKSKYADYQYKFLLIAKDAVDLKRSYEKWVDKCKTATEKRKNASLSAGDKRGYLDVLKVSFYPNIEIIDIPDLLRRLNMMILDATIMESIYKVVISSLRYFRHVEAYETDLADVVSILGSSPLEYAEIGEPAIFQIKKKIKLNKISKGRDELIMQNLKYTSSLDEIYETYNRTGTQKSQIVFHKLYKFYMDLQVTKCGAELLDAIINRTIEYVRDSKNCTIRQEDRLDFAVTIVVVDAFVRCKIFKRPDNDIAS